MLSKARQLHQKAHDAREQEQDLLKSLQLFDEAIIQYSEDKDLSGLAECLGDRSYTFKHLFLKTNDKSYLLLARAEQQAALEIAETLNDPRSLTLPLYSLAKIQDELEDYSIAVKNYKKALDTIITDGGDLDSNSPAHNRPAFKADMEAHLATAEYKSGDESALARLKNIAEVMEEAEELDEYAKAVWLSGVYLNLVDILKDKDQNEAKTYLEKAKKIIDADNRLKLRKEQWEKLSKILS
jgi:tetratricopeptide (TPR) repeat protein